MTYTLKIDGYIQLSLAKRTKNYKKAVLSQGNRAMPQLFFAI